MWSAADAADLIDPDMPAYADAVKADLSTLGGYFRAAGADAFNGMVSGVDPFFTCVAALAPAVGQVLTIRGEGYRITRATPTGQGHVRLDLEQQ